MPPTDAMGHAAFGLLERALARRRAAQADLRSYAVGLALALLVSGFVYWQVRVPLDGAVRAAGIEGGIARLAAALGVCLALAGLLAFERQAAALRRPPGPEWLALPVPPGRVLAHLRGEARRVAAVAGVPAAAALAAGIGLLPPWVLLLAAAAALLGWLEVTRAAAALARLLARPRHGPERGLPAATALLTATRAAPPARAHRPPAWRRRSPAAALAALDARASLRHAPSRHRLLLALVLAGMVLLAWASGAPPLLRRAQSFAALLLTAAALGGWALARAADTPASLHRPLPLSPRDAWWARASRLAALLAALAAAAALAGALQGQGGVAGIALLWPLPALAVAMLGLHHGLTLPSHPAAAEGLYVGWLGVMLAASWMIPLLGWVVLLAALLHSLRRLPRGHHPEALG